MADFQLVNENGSIVAKNPETGETRPVPIEFLEADNGTIGTLNDDIEYVLPTDDVVATINQGSTETDFIVFGEHTITDSLKPPNRSVIHHFGLIKLEDSVQKRIVDGIDSKNVTINGYGMGVFEGNADTVTYTGNKADHAGVSFEGALENITLKNFTARNVLGAAAVRCAFTEGSNNNVTGYPNNTNIQNVYVYECGNGNTVVNCDGIYTSGSNITVTGCRIKQITDTAIACDDGQHVRIEGNYAHNPANWNSGGNDYQMDQGITLFALNRDAFGTIRGNTIDNPGGICECYTTMSNQGNVCRPSFVDNTVRNTHNVGVKLTADVVDGEVTGNLIRETQGNGIDAVGSAIISNNVVSYPTENGILSRASGSTVVNNRVIGATLVGIVIGTGASDVQVAGNYVDGEGVSTDDGLLLSGDNYNIGIVNNRITQSGGYGIDRTQTTDRVVYVANRLRGNTNGAFNGSLATNSVETANIT